MNSIKRAAAILVVLVMAVSMLSACGSSAGNVNDVGAQGASASESTQQAADSKGEPKIDTSPFTFDMFVEGDWYHKQWDPINNLFDKMVTDATGVTVNITSGNVDKLSALIASNDLPDVITAWYVYPQVQMLQKSGKVWAIDELIAKYAPDFKIPQSMIDWHKQDDGHLYGIVNYFYAPEKLKEGENLPTHVVMRARKDIMDSLGIKAEDFDTKAGTIDALRKVKGAKLKYNGFNVEVSYIHPYDVILFFGASREDKEGNLLNREYQPEALEAYKFVNQLYREGLLAKDILTLTNEDKKKKVGQGSVFAYTGSLISNDQALYTMDKNAIMTRVGPIKGDAGKQPYFDPSPMAGWTSTMINKDTKNPERIIKFFEYLYNTDEMHLNCQFGPRGAVWEYDENGKVKYTEQYLKDREADSAKADLKYGNASFCWVLDWIPVMRAWPAPTNPSEQAAKDAEDFYNRFSYSDLAFSNIYPEAGTDIGAVKTRIDEYHQKIVAKMVFAKTEAEVEKYFNEMIEQEKKLGYDQLYAWQNERFKAAKKKLGIDFAWPANRK